MGIKRVVNTDFWLDEKVEMFTPEEKYFWLFLLTNPQTKQLGIYHLTLKQMSFYLGYEIETCKRLVERFENNYKLIKYIDGEIAIKNFLKHSVLKGGTPVEDCINSDIKSVKNKCLIDWVFNTIDCKNINATVNKVITKYKENKESTKENKEININDNDNDNDSIVYDSCTIRAKKQFTPPTIEEIEAYCNESGYYVDSKKFFDYFDTSGWKDSEGKPVKNWKQKIITWATNGRKDYSVKSLNDSNRYDTSKNKELSKEELERAINKLNGKN